MKNPGEEQLFAGRISSSFLDMLGFRHQSKDIQSLVGYLILKFRGKEELNI